MRRRRRAFRRELGRGAIGIAAWNTKNATEARLRRYIKSRLRAGDVAIVLTEVWSRHDALDRIANRLGIRLLAEDPDPGGRAGRVVSERGDTVVLLAPGFVLESWNVVVLDQQWTVFSHGRVHAPRRLIRVVGHVRGQRVELLAVHGPTGANKAAVAEFLDTVADILTKTRPGTLSVAVGDFNVRLPDARRWAQANGLEVDGRGPDLGVTNGATVALHGRKRRSDHHTMAHRFTLAA